MKNKIEVVEVNSSVTQKTEDFMSHLRVKWVICLDAAVSKIFESFCCREAWVFMLEVTMLHIFFRVLIEEAILNLCYCQGPLMYVDIQYIAV